MTSSLFRRLRESLAWRFWYCRVPFGQGVLRRCHAFPRIFSSWRDCCAYARALLTLDKAASPVVLRLKELQGNSIACRPHTSDPWVLWDTFFNRFQAPPPGVAPTRCIVDLGANVGYTAAFLAAHYPSAKVLAVEMDGQNAHMAAANLASYGERCHVVHAAVWSSDGETEYAGPDAQCYRIVSLGTKGNPRNIQKVATRSLDSLFDEHGLTAIDYVKMDIEGAEAEVLGSSLKWTERVKALKIELHKPATYEFCSDALGRVGFKCSPDTHRTNTLIAIRS